MPPQHFLAESSRGGQHIVPQCRRSLDERVLDNGVCHEHCCKGVDGSEVAELWAPGRLRRPGSIPGAPELLRIRPSSCLGGEPAR